MVEPVFGQIKQGRGFRQFLVRGLEKVHGEWSLICTGHNLLKLFRHVPGRPGQVGNRGPDPTNPKTARPAVREFLRRLSAFTNCVLPPGGCPS